MRPCGGRAAYAASHTRAAFGRRGQTRLRAPELPHHAARRALQKLKPAPTLLTWIPGAQALVAFDGGPPPPWAMERPHHASAKRMNATVKMRRDVLAECDRY